MSGCPALCFHRLGKCNGGGRGYFFVLTRLRSSSQIESYLQFFCINSSALVQSNRILFAVFSPFRRPNFLLSEKKVGKETDTESLSNQTMQNFLYAPVHTTRPCVG